MFSNPLGLLGLLGVAAILGLHLFRRRRPPVIVSALFLWEEAAGAARGGRTREPLRRSLSLMAEILCALLLTLALAGPRWAGSLEVQHYVAVLDTSASMLASGQDGRTTRDRARAHVERMIERLAKDARVTLVGTGPEPAVLAGPFALMDEARACLAEDWPVLGDHDPTKALLLATELSGDAGTVDFVTDSVESASGGPKVEDREENEAQPRRIRRVALGEAIPNVGITGALRSPLPDGSDDARIVVQNWTDAAVEVEVRLALADGSDEDASLAALSSAVSLAAGQSRSLSYRLPAKTPVLEVALRRASGPDGFELDDTVSLSPPPRKKLRLASKLDRSSARALGLREEDSAARWAEILPDAIAVDAGDEPHLVLSAESPAAAPEARSTAGLAAPWQLLVQTATGTTDLVGPYLLDRHPLLRGVSFDGVIWSLDEALSVPRAGETTLAFAGELPLVTETISPLGVRTWRLLLDPARSTLGRSTDWPILLANAAEERRRALPGPVRTQLGAGERFQWRQAPAEPLELVAPSGASTTFARAPSGDWVTPRLGELGVWTVRSPSSGETLTEVGVSLLSAAESDLSRRSGSPRLTDLPELAAAKEGSGQAGARLGPLRTLLAILALGFLALDWWALSRLTAGREGGRA